MDYLNIAQERLTTICRFYFQLLLENRAKIVDLIQFIFVGAKAN